MEHDNTIKKSRVGNPVIDGDRTGFAVQGSGFGVQCDFYTQDVSPGSFASSRETFGNLLCVLSAND